jgi:hypothetical protein
VKPRSIGGDKLGPNDEDAQRRVGTGDIGPRFHRLLVLALLALVIERELPDRKPRKIVRPQVGHLLPDRRRLIHS